MSSSGGGGGGGRGGRQLEWVTGKSSKALTLSSMSSSSTSFLRTAEDNSIMSSSSSSNSLSAMRRKSQPKDYEKKRQKEDKYFYNSVMDRRRAKPITTAICKNFPGLSKKQLELCFRYPDVMASAIQGLQLAVTECQYQFQKHRWNCSALETKNRNPHSSAFLQKGKLLYVAVAVPYPATANTHPPTSSSSNLVLILFPFHLRKRRNSCWNSPTTFEFMLENLFLILFQSSLFLITKISLDILRSSLFFRSDSTTLLIFLYVKHSK